MRRLLAIVMTFCMVLGLVVLDVQKVEATAMHKDYLLFDISTIVDNIALKTDETVVTWGTSKISTGLTGIAYIAPIYGQKTTYMITSDGRARSWDINGNETTENLPANARLLMIDGSGNFFGTVKAIQDGYSYPMILYKNGGLESSYEVAPNTLTGTYVIPNGFTNNVAAMATGCEFRVALKMDGTVAVAGYTKYPLAVDGTQREYYGECNVPSGLNNVVSVAAGNNHVLALKSDGTIVTWGGDNYYEKTPPIKLTNGTEKAVAIVADYDYSMALKENGTIEGWGVDTTGLANIPSGLNNVAAIGLKNGTAVALKSDGTVVTWGSSCSVPSGLNLGAPPKLSLSADGKTIIVSGVYGGNSTVNLYNSSNQKVTSIVGNGNITNLVAGKYYAKQEIVGVTPRKFLSAASAYVNVLGPTPTPTPTLTPTPTPTATPKIPIAPFLIGGNEKVTVMGADDVGIVKLYNASGREVGGRIGNGEIKNLLPGDNYYARQMVNGIQSRHSYNVSVTSEASEDKINRNYYYSVITCGGYHTLALKADGTIAAWGRNNNGQCNIPTGLNDVVSIEAGGNHSLVLKSNGMVAAWGNNSNGQCNVPEGTDNLVAISAGDSYSMALKANGTVVAWGNNSNGQCNVPSGLNNVVAIDTGLNVSMALKSDGRVAAWGNNASGQCNIPAGLNNVVDIDGGANHLIALKSNGTVAAWGGNTSGQCNVPVGLNNVVVISAGYGYSMALKSDGTITAWGDNTYGQCNIPTGLTNVVAIASGYDHALALKADGTVVTWGRNNYLQITNLPAGLKLTTPPVLASGAEKVTVSGVRNNFIVNLYNSLGQKIGSRIGAGHINDVPIGTGYYAKQILDGLTPLPLTISASNVATSRPGTPNITGGSEKVTLSGVDSNVEVRLYNLANVQIGSRTGSGEISNLLPGTGYYAKQIINSVESAKSNTVNVASGLKAVNKVMVGKPFSILVEGKLGAVGAITNVPVYYYKTDGTVAGQVNNAVEVQTYAEGYSIIKSKSTYNGGNGFTGEGFKEIRVGGQTIYIWVTLPPSVPTTKVTFD